MSEDRVPFADRAQYWVARALALLPSFVLVGLSGEKPVVVDGQTLDPHLQLLRALRRMRRAPGLVEPDHLVGRARFRREMRALAGPAPRVRATRDFVIDGPAGEIRVRHYAPESDVPEPLLVYLHGGGFVIGDLDTHDRACRILCREARVHVLSVDYRRAPEHPFPAALDDADAAFEWARTHAAMLGADPARVAIGGDSAGGNLAAVVSRLTTERGTAPVAQLLIYPATDARRPHPSADLFGDGYFLSNADREAFTRHYIAGTGVSGDDPRVAPMCAPSLRGLPPALVITAGFDTLRDEGEAYAEALAAVGVPSRPRRFPALGHGFVNMTGITPAARRAMVTVGRDLRQLIDLYSPDAARER